MSTPKGSANGAIYKSPGQARSASPWVTRAREIKAWKAEIHRQGITPFQGWNLLLSVYQGRRAPLRFALAPGCHILRRWRSVPIEGKAIPTRLPPIQTVETHVGPRRGRASVGSIWRSYAV